MESEAPVERRVWDLKLVLLAGLLVGAAALFEFDLAEGEAPWAWVLYWTFQLLVLGAIAWFAGLGPAERTVRIAVVLVVSWALGWFLAFVVAFSASGGETG